MHFEVLQKYIALVAVKLDRHFSRHAVSIELFLKRLSERVVYRVEFICWIPQALQEGPVISRDRTVIRRI
jgi:hypothetical protein